MARSRGGWVKTNADLPEVGHLAELWGSLVARLVQAIADPKDGSDRRVRRLSAWESSLRRRYLRHPIALRPLAYVLGVLGSAVIGAVTLRHAMDGDEDDNHTYALKPEERVHLAGLWLVELVTPSTIAGLRLKLGEMDIAEPLGQNPLDWLDDMRGRRDRIGSTTLATYIQTGSSTMLTRLSTIETDLPEEIHRVKIELVSLLTGISAIVARFSPSEKASQAIQAALTEPRRTRVLYRNKVFYIDDVSGQKARAVRAIRRNLRTHATEWLETRFPGVFASTLVGPIPTLELIVTEADVPLQWSGLSSPSWMDLTDLTVLNDGWVSRWHPFLRLKLPHGTPSRGVLACRLEDLNFEGPLLQGLVPMQLAERLDLYLENLPVLFAIRTLVHGWQGAMSTVRDLANKQDFDERPVSSLRRLRQDLLIAGIDMAWCTRELRQMPKHLYRLGEIDFLMTPYPGFQSSLIHLSDSFRQEIRFHAKSVRAAEFEMRQILNVTSGLTSAISNLKMQRTAVLLAVISLLAAIGAVVVAVVALTL